MTTVSAIVCTYNRCESLRETLQALKEQVLQDGLALEVVVVDNNSTDHTRRVVEGARQAARWPIRYVFEARQGLSHARNRGVLEAKGEWMAFTDDDVIPERNWAQALQQAFMTYGADCVGGKVLPRWSVPPPAWMLDPTLRPWVWGSLALLDRGPEPILSGERHPRLLYGANLAFRKTLFDEMGLFRTDLGRKGSALMGGEETDFCVRLYKAGKRLVYAPRAVVYHTISPERMRLQYVRRLRLASGRSLVRLADSGERYLPRWVIRECIEHGLSALWAYARGRQIQGIQREGVFWTDLGRIVETVSLSLHRGGEGSPAGAASDGTNGCATDRAAGYTEAALRGD